MNSLPPYRASLKSEWIDYNGHLRDAYYGLIASLAIDAVMDHLGLDEAYRERTACTLYTLESHMHYLHEVKQSDALTVETCILAADAKRMITGCRFLTGGSAPLLVAAGESLLLHVQQGEKPGSCEFPSGIRQTIGALRATDETVAAFTLRSRVIELKRRPTQ